MSYIMIWYNVSKAGNTDGKEVLSKTLAEIGKMVRGFLFTLYKQIYYKREKWKEAEMELILWLAKSKKNSEKYNVSRELENQLIAGYFTLAFSSLTNFVEQWTYYTTQKTKANISLFSVWVCSCSVLFVHLFWFLDFTSKIIWYSSFWLISHIMIHTL